LRQLSAWMPDMQVPLEQLQVLEDSKRLLVRIAAGHLAEPTGQLNIDFATQAVGPTMRDIQPNFKIHSADGWFDRACQHEEAEEFEEAAAAYRQALLVGGPTPELCFNLANVLYRLDKKAEASERFRQVVELDPAFAEAWNNLGITLAELKQCEEAVTALQHAVEQSPDYADSYFNLADCLEEIGCPDEAARYWQAYIRLDPQSNWGAYARQRAQGRKSAD
jgi:tetratricopeptide (TPR) repeat protein